MPNIKGWYSKEEFLETGLPCYFPASDQWTHTPYDWAVLLTKSRCEQLGVPILGSGREFPSAFRFLGMGAFGETREDEGFDYIPLYDRTDAFELLRDSLLNSELMVNGHEIEVY